MIDNIIEEINKWILREPEDIKCVVVGKRELKLLREELKLRGIK